MDESCTTASPQVSDPDMQITARACRTCRDACRDQQLAVSFDVGGMENVPGISGACAICNFTYLVTGLLTNKFQKGSYMSNRQIQSFIDILRFNMTRYCIEFDNDKGNSSDFELTKDTPYLALTGS